MFGNQLPNHRKSSVLSSPSLDKGFPFVGPANLFVANLKRDGSVFGKSRLHKEEGPESCWRRLQVFYEKSRLHYLLPILILVIYSFLGGFIFYSIEAPEERAVLQQKKEYIEGEETSLMIEIMRIQRRTRSIFSTHHGTEDRLKELRKYRPFAMNRLNKAVYWYVLQVYYLNDQESYKASLLHPSNPERIWRTHFNSNFGRIFALKNYTQQLSERCWEIGIELVDETSSNKRLKKSLEEFNRFTGLYHILRPMWTFWNSMFLAVTTYSTIGYGNITPKSKLGKLAAMVYAVIGIPLVLMILHKLGRFCLLGLEYFWNKAVWVMETISCVKNAEKLKGKMKHDSGMPVLLAIGVAFGWMFLCAAIFLQFEDDWDYFKSFYFFFCSLTTIGYGDVTPTHSEDMFLIFGFIIIGLSLVSMCVNVVQLKLEELFEELLISMMEEYGAPDVATAADLKPKLTVVDLWKAWKRRNQRRDRGSQHFEMVQTRKSEFNFWKIFPFAKRRREIFLHEVRTRLKQTSRGTQTDVHLYPIHTLKYVSELDELSSSESGAASINVPDGNSLSVRSGGDYGSSNGSTAKRVRVVVTDQNHSSSPSFVSSSSSSSYVRRYLPSRQNERRHTLSTTNTSAFGGHPSTIMTGGEPSEVTPQSSAEPFPRGRRWTFFEIGKTPRGMARGLVVPYMYTKPSAKSHETTEMKRLIAEIDSRLNECRSLVSPCSRAPSAASSDRTSFK